MVLNFVRDAIYGGSVQFLLSCAWLAVVAWLLFRVFSQRNLLERPFPIAATQAGAAPKIAVIVPARDEEHNIERCLGCLMAQDYAADRLSVIVVDDHSTDATLSAAESLAARYANILVLRCPPLPPGWIGKSHACAVGARAVAKDVEWLCFVDADVEIAPAALASAVAMAASRALALVSLAPRQRLESFAERLIIPCGLYLLAVCQDLRRLQSPQCDDVTVTGQFMLVSRAAYEDIGGHAAIARDICEDKALALLIKRSGGRVALCDGHELITTRMYTNWQSLWPGLVKNLVDMLGGLVPTAAIALAVIAFAWATLLVPISSGSACIQNVPLACVGLFAALIGTAAVVGLHVTGTFYFGIPVWFGLLFPVGYVVGAIMALDSIVRRLRGRVPWKGRTYP
jgi:chlorobactene glucosyltransferase